MHHGNPPQTEVTTPAQPRERRRAIVLRLSDGGWFRGRRPRGGARSVQRLAQALLFPPGSLALEQARAKSRRLGVEAAPQVVKIVIGGTPAN